MKGVVHTYPQGTPEWKAGRLGLATASRFGDILAKNRSGGEAAARKNYRTQLVLERLTGKTPYRFEKTEAMEWGSETEELARVEYELRTGKTIQQLGMVEHAFLKAAWSPDGVDDPETIVETLEIKCFNSANHLEMLHTSKLPGEYKAQAQGGLWIGEGKRCVFVSYDPDFPPHAQLVIVIEERDQDYIDNLMVEVDRFLKEVDAEVEFIKNYKEGK